MVEGEAPAELAGPASGTGFDGIAPAGASRIPLEAAQAAPEYGVEPAYDAPPEVDTGADAPPPPEAAGALSPAGAEAAGEAAAEATPRSLRCPQRVKPGRRSRAPSRAAPRRRRARRPGCGLSRHCAGVERGLGPAGSV